MEEIELISNRDICDSLEYDIFLCYNYDLVQGYVEDRFSFNWLSDCKYPVLTNLIHQLCEYLKNNNDHFLEDGTEFTLENIDGFWDEYDSGFYEGYYSFRKKIKDQYDVMPNQEFIKQILISTLSKPFDHCFCGYYNINGKKIVKPDMFRNTGILVGRIYYAWSFIIQSNKMYSSVVKEVYSDLIPYFSYFHENHDLRHISDFPINNGSNTLSLKDILRPPYYEKYDRFVNALKKEFIELSMPMINLDGKWNFKSVQVLRIFYSLSDKKILSENVLDKDAKKTIAFEFSVPFGSIKSKVYNDIGKSGEALKIQSKIDHLIDKIFLES